MRGLTAGKMKMQYISCSKKSADECLTLPGTREGHRGAMNSSNLDASKTQHGKEEERLCGEEREEGEGERV